jgi:hypothetical protein
VSGLSPSQGGGNLLTHKTRTMKITTISLIALLSIAGAASAHGTSAEPSFKPTTNDTIDSDSTCIDTPGWTDIDTFTCAWYEEHDAPGCPTYGDKYSWKYKDGVIYEPFGDGTANHNCCHCKNKNLIPTAKPTSPCSGNTLNWEDVDNYTCAWYEANDAPGCPRFGNAYRGSQGVANDNCCYCFGSGSPTSSMPTSAFPTIALVPSPTPTAE